MSVDDDLFAAPPAPVPTSDESHVDVDQAAAIDEPTEPPSGNRYPDVFAFVDEYLVHVYARQTSGASSTVRWCPSWHRHSEAVARLTALWRAFEALRTDPGTGASVWWLEHADPMMRALTAHDGPFKNCHDREHVAMPALPTVPPTST